MRLSQNGYAQLCAWVRSMAEELCAGRVVFLLEGGYALSGLREGSEAVLEVITAAECPRPQPVSLLPTHPLRPLVEKLRQHPAIATVESQ